MNETEPSGSRTRPSGRRIVRHGRIHDTEEGLSEFPHVILNQARVHDFYLEIMRNAPTRLVPDYGAAFARPDDRPRPARSRSTVRLRPRRGGGRRPRRDRCRARTVVGCDGARSEVRAPSGRELRGEAANQAWGVMDVLAYTDFPDIRLKSAGASANDGNIAGHPARRRLSRAALRRDRQARGRTSGWRRPRPSRRRAGRRGAAHPAPLHARREGGRVVVGLRDRPAADRQVRRRGGGARRRRAARGCSSPATPATPTARRPGRA